MKQIPISDPTATSLKSQNCHESFPPSQKLGVRLLGTQLQLILLLEILTQAAVEEAEGLQDLFLLPPLLGDMCSP